MAELTGIPLGVALGWWCAGRLTRAGVQPPEGALDPAPFLADVAAAGAPAGAGGDPVSVTRSWDPTAGDRYRTAMQDARRYVGLLSRSGAGPPAG